jgi:hypothetical protein
MVLKRREKILAAAVVVLLLISAAPYLYNNSFAPLGQLRESRDRLAKEVEDKKAKISRAHADAELLAQWQKQSLPWNHEVARSLYQTWLRGLVDRSGLRGAKVESTEGQARRGIYWKQRFSVTAQGTTEQLTKLLYEFYSAGYLHKIGRLTISPIKDADLLELTISIETLSLPGADAKDGLPSQKPKQLALAPLADYRQAFVRRKMEAAEDGKEERFVESGGLFANYQPKPEPPRQAETHEPEPQPPAFDLAKHTYVTATIEVDGRPQVWMDVRTKGDKLKLFEGDPFKIGDLDGKVLQIALARRSVLLEIGGQQREVRLGNNLEQGNTPPHTAPPADAQPPPDQQTNPPPKD